MTISVGVCFGRFSFSGGDIFSLAESITGEIDSIAIK